MAESLEFGVGEVGLLANGIERYRVLCKSERNGKIGVLITHPLRGERMQWYFASGREAISGASRDDLIKAGGVLWEMDVHSGGAVSGYGEHKGIPATHKIRYFDDGRVEVLKL